MAVSDDEGLPIEVSVKENEEDACSTEPTPSIIEEERLTHRLTLNPVQ